MKKFKIYYNNAKITITQLRRGEWEFDHNSLDNKYYVAKRKGKMLWVGTGPFYCEYHDSCYNTTPTLGLVFRHLVWWVGVRPILKKLKIGRIPKLKDD